MTRPRPTRTTKIVLIVVGCVLVLCLGGGLAVFFGFRAVKQAGAPARAATEQFLGDLQDGNTAAAYQMLCASSQAQLSEDQFAATASPRRPATFTIVTTSVRNTNGKTSALVTARMDYSDGLHEQHIFQVLKDGDTWKICGNPY